MVILGILDLHGGMSNIGHHVLKLVDDKIEPIIRYMDHKTINQKVEAEVILVLWDNYEPRDKLKYY